MSEKLHDAQQSVKREVVYRLNDAPELSAVKLRMPRPKKPTETSIVRLHFIPEWADKFGYSRADLSRLLGVDKGTVTRWFQGTLPSDTWIEPLRQLFGLDDPRDLFRHPDDDWMTRFLRGRDAEERERIQRTLEAAFPRKRA